MYNIAPARHPVYSSSNYSYFFFELSHVPSGQECVLPSIPTVRLPNQNSVLVKGTQKSSSYRDMNTCSKYCTLCQRKKQEQASDVMIHLSVISN